MEQVNDQEVKDNYDSSEEVEPIDIYELMLCRDGLDKVATLQPPIADAPKPWRSGASSKP